MEHNFWYKSEGGLELKLCEQESFGNNDVRERCCSCNEAKYEVREVYSDLTWMNLDEEN